MIRPDAFEAQGRPSRPEIVAAFVRSHAIKIQTFFGERTGVDEYHFMQYAQGSAPVTIGVISFDRYTGSILPISPEEMRRRLDIPGFVRDVAKPFVGLLISTGGDYSAEEFDPIDDASAGVPDGTRAQARIWRHVGSGTQGISES